MLQNKKPKRQSVIEQVPLYFNQGLKNEQEVERHSSYFS